MTQVRFLPPQLTEVIRLDEEPASKAGAGDSSVVGSSPSASASGNNTCPWPSGKGSRLPTWRGGFDSRRALSNTCGSVAQRQSGRLLSDSAWVRVPLVPFTLRGVCWLTGVGFRAPTFRLVASTRVRFLHPQLFSPESRVQSQEMNRSRNIWTLDTQLWTQTAGSFNGRTRRSERRNAGSSPAPATAALPLCSSYRSDERSSVENNYGSHPAGSAIPGRSASSRSLGFRVE